jgi:hypothetical protein
VPGPGARGDVVGLPELGFFRGRLGKGTQPGEQEEAKKGKDNFSSHPDKEINVVLLYCNS